MINDKLINPKNIVVIGGSNNLGKPGGKVLKNLLDSSFQGDIYVVNPKEDKVQGLKCYQDINKLPSVDLAILSIPSTFTLENVKILSKDKQTRGFIILSAGYSEMGPKGKELEDEIAKTINKVGGSLIGPNCIGILTSFYNATFTEPSPKLDPMGCDFVSGSGATAVFIIEAALPKGLSFASIYSVGNSAQIGVEEVVKYWDENFDPIKSPKVKLLYIENIDKPKMLLKHANSLINKGCRVAAIKAGSSKDGSRAASSHTGAMASNDLAVTALFNKAGIVRCYGRDDLITTAAVLKHKELLGKNIAIITHAGGPGVMLTDNLSNNGLKVPKITSKAKEALLKELYPGSCVDNPIDFLATGTADQLSTIIDYVDNKFHEIDGMVIIFGTPGLFKVFDVYQIIDKKMKTTKKPIYPVLPSLKTAKEEIDKFLSYGRINFPDEVALGKALTKVYFSSKPAGEINLPEVKTNIIREVIKRSPDGYISPVNVQKLLDAAGIKRVNELVVNNQDDLYEGIKKIGLPIVMKVIGPVHKTDVGGVILDVSLKSEAKKEFERLIAIKDATGVLIQPMLIGRELFVGAKYEDKFGHIILCGLGGIYIEVFKDIAAGLSPINKTMAEGMIKSLKSYPLIKGIRGQEGIKKEYFIDTIVKLSALLEKAPEIKEMDINPLIGTPKSVVAVDARIRIEK